MRLRWSFWHIYRSARDKDHGMGRASRLEAACLGIMAQYISWGCPRWMNGILRLAFYK